MRGRWTAVLVVGALLGCGDLGGSSSSSSGGGGCGSEFCNTLTFGTAIGGNGFQLVGEGTTFSLAGTQGTLAFRLESQAEIGSRAVRLYVYSGTGTTSAPYAQRDYRPAQTYGHIMLSTFRVTDPGTYEVRAYLVQDGAGGSGTETRVTSAGLTMTQ